MKHDLLRILWLLCLPLYVPAIAWALAWMLPAFLLWVLDLTTMESYVAEVAQAPLLVLQKLYDLQKNS